MKREHEASRTRIEKVLSKIWAEVLGLERIHVEDNFFELGGDSINVLQVIAIANREGLQFTPKQFFQHPTIAELATVTVPLSTSCAEQGIVKGRIPLTPIQHWFFEQGVPEPEQWTQSILLEVHHPLKVSILQEAIRHLLVHHDALRVRFTPGELGWEQFCVGNEELVPFNRLDLSGLSGGELKHVIEAEAAKLRAGLNISKGPLMQVALFDLGTSQPNRLLIVIHHLVADGVSWRILLGDLQTAYMQLSRGELIKLPAKTTSLKQWAERLEAYAQSIELRHEMKYWLAQPWSQAGCLPVDFPDGDNTEALAWAVSVSLTAEETKAILQEIPKVYHVRVNDILITALVQAFAPWIGKDCLLIDLEGHGREAIFDDVDLSRTVGWFTSIFPVLLDLKNASGLRSTMKLTQEQMNHIPHKGIDYGILRYLSSAENARRLQSLPQAEVSFNYFGQFDQLFSGTSMFKPASETITPVQLKGLLQESYGLKGTRRHLIDISGSVFNGKLWFTWTYSKNVHRETTIRHLAEDYVAALRSIINSYQSTEAESYKPFNFRGTFLCNEEFDAKNKQLIEGRATGDKSLENVEAIFPLSAMQRGLLFHSLQNPELGIYIVQDCYMLYGDLNMPAFREAWMHVSKRHTALRTVFILKGHKQPLQAIHKVVNLLIEEHDWSDLGATDQKEQIESFLKMDREKGFDLTKSPPLRLAIIRLTKDVYQFILSFHHALLDGWSVSLLIREVFDFYQALCYGSEYKMDSNHPYMDYITWLHQQDLSQAEGFWRQILKGFTAPTPLGMIAERNGLSCHVDGFSEGEIKLSAATTAALQSFAQRHHLTLNTLIQGSWALLLSHYSGEKEVVFGVVVSGRPPALEGVESMVGLFINTLPARVQIHDKETLFLWLKKLQNQQVEMKQYEYSPLVKVKEWSEIPSGVPLFESILLFQNYPVDDMLVARHGNLKIENVRTVERTNYPLTLVAIPGSELILRLMYHTPRFNASTIAQMLDHLQTLLEGMLANPQARLSDIPLLTAAQQRQLLVEWNNTKTDYPRDATIPELFEAQVEQTPDTVAVIFGDHRLTYRDLNQRANQLSHYLRYLDVSPEVRVAICMERSLEMVIGLLGILKAGGTYVPLDPLYPKERLSFMLADAQVPVLLTQKQLIQRLPKHMARVVCLDEEWGHIAGESDQNPPRRTKAENLAYIIYTSGSTGKPKGVEVLHRGIVRLLFGTDYVKLDATQRFLHMSAITFDASTFEIWGALLHGAQCVFLPGRIPSLEEIGMAIQKYGITTLWLTAALFNVIIDEAPRILDGIRQLLVGGDALSVSHVLKALEVLHTIQIINGYGPTEGTTFTCCYTIPRQLDKTALSIPIGRPISNTQVYLLNSHLQPVPVGVPGEIYIGGDGLARGYLNQPELTAEKFIPNPFNDDPGAHLYKTGDLARYLPDGNIEFIGRLDHQVKIRGFRIELGEIESVLGQHPAVRQVAVITREDVPGSKSLVAYIVPVREGVISAREMRHFLKEKLPDYMIPSAFVFLEALPLTPNNKINRKELPPPSHKPSNRKECFVAPQDAIEVHLMRIWEDILDIHKIGIRNNFFELGGNSLQAVRLIDKIEHFFGKRLPLDILWHNGSTIEDMAVALRREEGSTLWSSAIPIKPDGSRRSLFCTHIAGGYFFYYDKLASYLNQKQPLYAIPPQYVDGKHHPHTTIETMASHCIQLMRQVQPEGPYSIAGFCSGGVIAFEMAQQLHAQGEEMALLALLDSLAPGFHLRLFIRVLLDFLRLKNVRLVQERLYHMFLRAFGMPHLRVFQKASEAHRWALWSYKAKPYSGRITLFRPSKYKYSSDPLLGWGKLAMEGVDVHVIPGKHGEMVKEPIVQVMAKQLETHLAGIDANEKTV